MPTDKRKRLVQTSVVLLVMINTGFNIGIFSPTFPDIEVLTSSNTAQISTTLIWTGVASIVGVLVIGPLFDRMNGMLLMTVCLLLEGVAMGLAPTWSSLTAFQALASLTCVFNFALMSGCLTVNRGLWKTSIAWYGPVIQTTDLMHALGTALIPQVIKPFITGSHTAQPASTTLPANNVTCETVEATSAASAELGGFQPVRIAYLLVAVSDGVVAVVCLMTFFWERSRYCKGDTNVCQWDDEDNDVVQLLPDSSAAAAASDADEPSSGDEKLDPCNRPSIILLVVVYLIFVVNGGRDALLTGLLFTYAEEYLHWTVSSGTLLVTMYHVTRVLVHAILVPVSRWVSPTRLTIFNVATLIVSAALMMAALVGGDALTAAGVIVAGVATSNVHPTTITLVDESVHVVASVMALFISAVGLGQIVVAPVTGRLLQTVGVASFSAMMSALALAGLVLFVVYCVLLELTKSTERRRLRKG